MFIYLRIFFIFFEKQLINELSEGYKKGVRAVYLSGILK